MSTTAASIRNLLSACQLSVHQRSDISASMSGYQYLITKIFHIFYPFLFWTVINQTIQKKVSSKTRIKSNGNRLPKQKRWTIISLTSRHAVFCFSLKLLEERNASHLNQHQATSNNVTSQRRNHSIEVSNIMWNKHLQYPCHTTCVTPKSSTSSKQTSSSFVPTI